ERLARRRLARAEGDEVANVRLAHERDVGRAREGQGDAVFAIVAQAVAHAGCEALVRDADVLADAEARQARERTGRWLEDEAHGARLALRRELIRQRVEAHRVLATDAEAVLEEGPARVVVLEELHEATL